VERPEYPDVDIHLTPGRYRVFGFPPMTGLLLNKWIEVSETNQPGHYGPADIPIRKAIPNIDRIEDEEGRVLWPPQA